MPVFYFLAGLVLLGIGIFAIAAPEDYIYLQHFMRFNQFEPTDIYIKYTRVIGIIQAVGGIALVIGAFFT